MVALGDTCMGYSGTANPCTAVEDRVLKEPRLRIIPVRVDINLNLEPLRTLDFGRILAVCKQSTHGGRVNRGSSAPRALNGMFAVQICRCRCRSDHMIGPNGQRWQPFESGT
jgi:hypothetical protein